MKINIVFAVGSLGIIVGSFLPWYTEVYSTGSQLVYDGMEIGWGVTPFVLGIVLLLLAVFAANSSNRIKVWAEGLLSAFLLFYGFVAIMASRDQVQTAPNGFLGPGLWLLMAGAVLHFVAFLVIFIGVRFITRPESG